MEEQEKKKSEYELRAEAAEQTKQQVVNSTLQWLQTDDKVKAYLTDFREDDVKRFVEEYPKMKGTFMEQGEKLGNVPEENQLHYVKKAEKNLMDIQRKKIFDLMCRWDANELKLDNIVCSDDFDAWLEDPNTCPHIAPINDTEFALYLKFMETDEYTDSYHHMYAHLSYEDYRDSDPCDDSELLEWCMYENLYTSNGEYFALPMIRTRQEGVYRKLAFAERSEEIERQYESGELKRYVPDTRKELSCHYYSHLEAFIHQNESREVLDRFRKMYAYYPDQLIRDNAKDQEEGDIVSKLERVMFELEYIREKIPIEANADWRVGLIEAYEKYEQQQLLSGLKYAYSEYRMRIDLSLGFEEKENRWADKNPNFVRDQILRGRALNGEPEDFDF